MTLTSILANFEAPTIDFDEVNFKLIFAFFLVVVFAMLTQYMIFAASSLKEPSLTMPFGYLAIIVGFIADTIFFEITFNMLSVLGILLTSAGLLSKLFISEGSKLKSDRKSMGNNVLNEE
jgi:drug/metabolite transporter (DMT)-like permease